MKVSRAVEIYIQRKQAVGLHYSQAAATLRIFARRMGNVSLSSVSQRQISSFLTGPRSTNNNTWLHKYRMLKNFLQYWKFRGKVKRLRMPVPRPPSPRTFHPYIYSCAELKRMLRATSLSQRSRNVGAVDSSTFRTFLLFLYGTGILVSEALKLSRKDIDLNENVMIVRRKGLAQPRRIPIGRDVHRLLAAYLRSSSRKQNTAEALFLNIAGKPVSYMAVYKSFRRVCNYGALVRRDPGHYRPRIYDLRFTFAVHRLASWYRQGINVERMLPALSEYLGEANLGSMQKYLAMTPERFRKQLRNLNLSPCSSAQSEMKA